MKVFVNIGPTIMRTCWAQYLLLTIVATLAAGTLLTGCGSKGPLYLPQPAEQAEQAEDR